MAKCHVIAKQLYSFKFETDATSEGGALAEAQDYWRKRVGLGLEDTHYVDTQVYVVKLCRDT